MKINIGDYLIETDNLQFIVKSKKVIEESRLTKQENIGKEVYKVVAYCRNFEGALKFIPQDILRTNDDINVIKEKLQLINDSIKEIKEVPQIEHDEMKTLGGEEVE
ncbi:hypothetical protein [Inconstantimicrobium mannanitabidum]|uniref:Uncharacterized protein n=1 Tax=Inconstantimicrobium mannanitabidum TaxID=1604901 RepID=A0ACB5R8W7_9CLOT|nr:hypothetical protein [Clostridium sp. TW13]GKX65625.1 hypothetical protein rsdtw13_08830 [Clostridium sp. TW13]